MNDLLDAIKLFRILDSILFWARRDFRPWLITQVNQCQSRIAREELGGPIQQADSSSVSTPNHISSPEAHNVQRSLSTPESVLPKASMARESSPLAAQHTSPSPRPGTAQERSSSTHIIHSKEPVEDRDQEYNESKDTRLQPLLSTEPPGLMPKTPLGIAGYSGQNVRCDRDFPTLEPSAKRTASRAELPTSPKQPLADASTSPGPLFTNDPRTTLGGTKSSSFATVGPATALQPSQSVVSSPSKPIRDEGLTTSNQNDKRKLSFSGPFEPHDRYGFEEDWKKYIEKNDSKKHNVFNMEGILASPLDLDDQRKRYRFTSGTQSLNGTPETGFIFGLAEESDSSNESKKPADVPTFENPFAISSNLNNALKLLNFTLGTQTRTSTPSNPTSESKHPSNISTLESTFANSLNLNNESNPFDFTPPTHSRPRVPETSSAPTSSQARNPSNPPPKPAYFGSWNKSNSNGRNAAPSPLSSRSSKQSETRLEPPGNVTPLSRAGEPGSQPAGERPAGSAASADRDKSGDAGVESLDSEHDSTRSRGRSEGPENRPRCGITVARWGKVPGPWSESSSDSSDH